MQALSHCQASPAPTRAHTMNTSDMMMPIAATLAPTRSISLSSPIPRPLALPLPAAALAPPPATARRIPRSSASPLGGSRRPLMSMSSSIPHHSRQSMAIEGTATAKYWRLQSEEVPPSEGGPAPGLGRGG